MIGVEIARRCASATSATGTGVKPVKILVVGCTSHLQPQPPSWPLFLRHLQRFASPDPLHPILSHLPSRAPQQQRDAPLAIRPILGSQDLFAKLYEVLVPSLNKEH